MITFARIAGWLGVALWTIVGGLFFVMGFVEVSPLAFITGSLFLALALFIYERIP